MDVVSAMSSAEPEDAETISEGAGGAADADGAERGENPAGGR